jgi:hypothetical protein
MEKNVFALSKDGGGSGTVLSADLVSGTISVSDSGGSPLGAEVTLLDSSGATVATIEVEDSSGAYEFIDVPEDTYTIEAALPGYATGTAGPFTVSGGDVTDMDIILIKAITGMTLAEAFEQIKAAGNSGEYLVELSKDESDNPNYDMTGFAAPVTIIVDGKGYTVNWASGTSTSAGCLTLSQTDITLVLKNVTFTGQIASNKTESLIWIKSGATLQMEDGAVLTGNQASNGGAVYIVSGGSFVMNGGSITGNKSSGYGHGVYIGTGAFMTMTGGSINGNTLKTDSSLINGVCMYGSRASLTMSAAARIDRLWLFEDSVVVTIAADFTGQDTVATLDIRSVSVGRQILQAAPGYAGLAGAVGRFALGNRKSSPSSDGPAITGFTIGADGKLQQE